MATGNTFQGAQSHAQSGRFPDMLPACQQIMHSHAKDPNVLLDVGTLLFNFGFLTKARLCFETARRRAPKDLRPLVNLANVAREAGDQAEARRLYAQLLGQLPDHPVVRRNALVSLEYDPAVSDALIRQDEIDVLIDLSGHTGGSHLAAGPGGHSKIARLSGVA